MIVIVAIVNDVRTLAVVVAVVVVAFVFIWVIAVVHAMVSSVTMVVVAIVFMGCSAPHGRFPGSSKGSPGIPGFLRTFP